MNEKLQELLDSVQRTAYQVSDVASDAAYGVTKKAGELLSVAKLNIQVVDLKAQVNTALREVGEMIYGTHTGNPTDSDVLLAKLQEIDTLQVRIAELNARIAKESAGPVCPTCGAPARAGDAFCRECGGKL